MADSNASFIPKNTQRLQRKVRTTHRVYLLSYVSYIFFFGTLIAVAGTYFYALQVTNQLDGIRTQLQTAKDRFSTEDIDGIRALEKKLLMAERFVNQMAAPSKLFTEIEGFVAQNIEFTSLVYEAMPNQQAKITLTGKAEEFNHILFQHDLMNRSAIFADAEIKQFDLVGPGGETESITTPDQLATAEDVVLTFVFGDDISTSIIPYTPQATAEVVDQDNVVTSVRSLEEATVSTEPAAAANETSL